MEEHKRFVADLETNFAKEKSSLSQDFDVKMKTQNESHDMKLNELGRLKDEEKETQKSQLQQTIDELKHKYEHTIEELHKNALNDKESV